VRPREKKESGSGYFHPEFSKRVENAHKRWSALAGRCRIGLKSINEKGAIYQRKHDSLRWGGSKPQGMQDKNN